MLTLGDLERRQDDAWRALEKANKELAVSRGHLKGAVKDLKACTAITMIAFITLIVPWIWLWGTMAVCVGILWFTLKPFPGMWRQDVYNGMHKVNKTREKFVDALQDVQDRKLIQLMDPKQFELLETQQQREDTARWQLVLMAREAKEKEIRARFEEVRELSMAFAEAHGDTERRHAISRLIMQRAEDDWSQQFED